MAEKRNILVRLDNRTRLMSAVLAATSYPDKSQDRQKHGVPLHARGTRKLIAEYMHHPAVTSLQVLLDQNTPLTSIFGYALRLSWPDLEIDEPPRWVPPRWNEHLKHFHEVTGLAKWWTDEDENWQTPVRHLNEIFSKVDFYTFLEPFFGTVQEQFAFIPNISYPTDVNLRVRVGGELVALIPPRKAWGDSAPWPYDNDPVYIYQEALKAYEELLFGAALYQNPAMVAALSEKPLPVGEKFAALHTTWSDQITALFTSATTAVFLEDAVNTREAKAYIQIQQKVEGLTILTGVIGILKRFMEEQKTGKYQGFADYLPNFVKHLRVVKTIAAL
jgi:hypothetical protein